ARPPPRRSKDPMATVDLAAALPPAPRTPQEAGLNDGLIIPLVAKHLHFTGELAGTALAQMLGVPFSVIEPSLNFLKSEGLCAIVGARLGAPALYRYRLTDAGRAKA